MGTVPNSDAFLAKFDTQGNLKWFRRWRRSMYDEAKAVAPDGSSFYIAGMTSSSTTNQDAFLASFDADGELQLDRTWGEDRGDDAYGAACSGEYVFISGARANQEPVWRHSIGRLLRVYSMRARAMADDTYLIEQPMRENWYVGIPVFLGEGKIGLVDSGYAKMSNEYVFPLIKERGHSSDEVDCLVNTHRDGDHIQGNGSIRRNTKAEITAHELEVEATRDVDVRLRDGDTIELGGRRFEVIHTPGHRPGAICLYEPRNCVLISGDAVCGERADLIRMDERIYIASIQKLLGLEVSLLIMGHPFRPLGKAILSGDEPRRMLEASISIAEGWQSRARRQSWIFPQVILTGFLTLRT